MKSKRLVAAAFLAGAPFVFQGIEARANGALRGPSVRGQLHLPGGGSVDQAVVSVRTSLGYNHALSTERVEEGGSFRLEIRDRFVPSDGQILEIELHAFDPVSGFTASTSVEKKELSSDVDLGRLTLRQETRLALRVVDSDRKPVPGAILFAGILDIFESEPSSENGEAAFRSVPDGVRQFEVEAFGFQSKVMALDLDQPPSTVEMERAAVLECRIDESRRSGGFHVSFEAKAPGIMQGDRWFRFCKGRPAGENLDRSGGTFSYAMRFIPTDDGIVALSGVAPGVPISVRLVEDDVPVSGEQTVTLKAGEHSVIELR